MPDSSENHHLAPLPDSLRLQLEKFRKHLWRIKITEAILAGILGLIVSFGLVFALDRIWDLSPLIRLIILIAGVSLFAIFAPLWINRWVFKHRKENQLARLIATHYPNLGDRLLGVVELQDQQESKTALSPKLREAAMLAVAHDAKSRDLQQALSSSWRNKLAMSVAAVALLAGISFLIYPSAGKNALKRWLMPLADTERFVFTKVDLSNVPQPLYVPLNEPFTIQLPLCDDSEQTPEYAEARYGTGTWKKFPLQDYRYALKFSGKRYHGNVSIKVGDARHQISVYPIKRPSIESITGTITYPDYLQRPAIERTLQAGILDVLEGSKLDLKVIATRKLSTATVGPAELHPNTTMLSEEELEIQGEPKNNKVVTKTISYKLSKDHSAILPATLTIGKKTIKLPITWTDIHGLRGSNPATINITPTKDSLPATYLQNARKQIYILHTKVLELDLVAEDDYGIKAAGLEWVGSFSTPTANQPAKGEQAFIEADPFNTSANQHIYFDFVAREIIPQKLTIRSWVKDFNPNSKRVYSEPIEVFVLSKTEHANYIKERMKSTLSDLEDSIRQEQENLDENKRIEKDLKDPKKAAEALKKLADQEAKELNNKDAIKKLSKEMKELLKQAMENEDISPKTLQEMKKTADKLNNMEQQMMPKIAKKLSEAQSRKNSEEKTQKDIKDAIEQQEKLIKEMKKTAQQADKANKKLEAGTFVQRLKQAASEEDLIVSHITNNADEFIIQAKEDYSELDPKAQRLLQKIFLQQEQTSSDVRWIIEDLGFFYSRTQKEIHKKLLDAMRKSTINDDLSYLEKLLEHAYGGRSRTQADEIAVLLRKWAKILDESNKQQNNAGGGGGGGGGDSQEDKDFEFKLRIMRMVQREQAVRARTRALEQQLRSINPNQPQRTRPIVP